MVPGAQGAGKPGAGKPGARAAQDACRQPRCYPGGMVLFRILLGIDALVAGLVAWMFLLGLADGTVSPRNMAAWMVILLALGGVLAGGVALRRGRRPGLANALLGLLAVPAILALAWVVSLFALGVRWT